MSIGGVAVRWSSPSGDVTSPAMDVPSAMGGGAERRRPAASCQDPFAPGTNPDTSYATIDWRFVRNWSFETTFGDYESTFADLVWEYRY
jgi:hypothetical protein